MNEEDIFPRWFYGPNGEAEIFEAKELVPAGWSPWQGKFDTPAETSDNTPKRRGRPPAKPLAPQEEAKAVEVTEDEF
jgi:hypothetical protein